MKYSDIERAARAQGWQVDRTRRGHRRLRPPDKTAPLIIGEPDTLPWAYDDGGAGPGPEINDCVTRAIAIAAGRPYGEVYDMVDEFCCAAGAWAIDCEGVPIELTAKLMSELGWRWVPLRNASLVTGSLPDEPRLIADMPGHVCAVIDGVVHDNHDCTWDDDGRPARVRGVYLPPCPVDDDPRDDDWHRLKLAAETGALPALIRQSVSDPFGDDDECYCDMCLLGDSWKCVKTAAPRQVRVKERKDRPGSSAKENRAGSNRKERNTPMVARHNRIENARRGGLIWPPPRKTSLAKGAGGQEKRTQDQRAPLTRTPAQSRQC